MKWLVVLIMALSPAAFSQVYTWTDENGVTHFESRPPSGQQHETVEIGETNRIDAPSEDLSRSLDQRAIDRRLEQTIKAPRSSGIDYICTNARNSVSNVKERWANVKSQGYTQSQRNHYEQRIREAERHRDNICR